MVLQRNKPIRIAGETDCSQTLEVLLNHVVITQAVVEAGCFTLIIPSQKAAEDVTLTISGSSGDVITYTSVDIGEVWIAGGQSNMELLMKYTANADDIISVANDPHFRLYSVAQWAFEGEESEGFKNTSLWDYWMHWTPENAPFFSATASYFALHLRKTLGVPVGIINCTYGGTSAVTWLDVDYLIKDEDLKTYFDTYEQGLAKMDIEEHLSFSYKMRETMNTPEALEQRELVSLRKIEPPSFDPSVIAQNPEQLKNLQAMMRLFTEIGPTSPNRPGGLYKTMVKKIAGYTCCGFIWYQGETDFDKGETYQKLFSALIACWRRDWKCNENDLLPFLFVQLAPFGTWRGLDGARFPVIREAQERVSKTVPNTWMASIMDVGDPLDIHPLHKQPVGYRLALLALGKVYSQRVLCEAPELVNIDITKGQLTLHFAHSGDGLYLIGANINALELHLNGKIATDFTFVVDGSKVQIYNKYIESKVHVEVRYACVGYCDVNLYNSANLAAKPFKWSN